MVVQEEKFDDLDPIKWTKKGDKDAPPLTVIIMLVPFPQDFRSIQIILFSYSRAIEKLVADGIKATAFNIYQLLVERFR
jgi:hypothetical protein